MPIGQRVILNHGTGGLLMDNKEGYNKATGLRFIRYSKVFGIASIIGILIAFVFVTVLRNYSIREGLINMVVPLSLASILTGVLGNSMTKKVRSTRIASDYTGVIMGTVSIVIITAVILIPMLFF
jgi:hypothetical protein